MTESTRDIVFYLSLPYTIIMKADTDGDYVARIEELQGCTAHGATQQEALNNLRESQQLWIEDCIASGDVVPEPRPEEDLPSGKWVQRVPMSIHKRLADLAKKENVNLNQLLVTILTEALEAHCQVDRILQNVKRRPRPRPHSRSTANTTAILRPDY